MCKRLNSRGVPGCWQLVALIWKGVALKLFYMEFIGRTPEYGYICE